MGIDAMPPVAACRIDDVDPDDVIRFDPRGTSHAIHRDPSEVFHSRVGLCTHERVYLSGGLVMDRGLPRSRRRR